MIEESLRGLVDRIGPLAPMLAVRLAARIARDLLESPPATLSGASPSGGDGAARGTFSPETVRLVHEELGVVPRVVREGEQPSSVASDIEALGKLLYFALAGSPAASPPAHLQGVAPWVEPSLAFVVHGMLLPDPSARCPSFEALLDALEPFTIGADHIPAEMLRPLPEEQRAPLSARVTLPERWPPEETSGAPSALGRVIAGRYALLRLLGKGGMGAVYEALGPDGERRAIKLIRSDRIDGDPQVLARFTREARAAMAIQSPHVTRILDVDLKSSPPYITMELLRGGDLAAHLRSAGPLSPGAAAHLFAQAAAGLAVAHSAGVVHRDIKPANLFLHETPEGEVVLKVCDFGVAKTTRTSSEQRVSEVTSTGSIVGSPHYMAPEQATGEKNIDLRVDIWALCLSLHEALCGVRPWGGIDGLGGLLVAICTRDVEPLQQLAPWVPEKLAEVVHKGLQRDPEARWASMGELRKALMPFATPGALRREHLAPPGPALRSVRPPPASRPAAPRSSRPPVSATTTLISPTASDAPPWRPLLVSALVVLLLGGALLLAFRREQGALDAVAPSPSASSPRRPAGSSPPRPAGPPDSPRPARLGPDVSLSEASAPATSASGPPAASSAAP